MEKFFEKLKKYWGWITLLISIFSFLIGGYNAISDKLEAQNADMAKAIQMSEKAIIWNKEIPIIERASVCDDYLSRGYNSYTKKLCENVILQDESLSMNNVDNDIVFSWKGE